MESPDPRENTEIPKQKRKRPAQHSANQRPAKVPKQSAPKTPQPRPRAPSSRKSGDLLDPSPTTVPSGSYSPPSPAPKTPESVQSDGTWEYTYGKHQEELWLPRILDSESDPTKKQEVLEKWDLVVELWTTVYRDHQGLTVESYLCNYSITRS
ncbi:hypothetical protein PITC_039670 [Penicillium italicum]|uniref:Uncharacterized protein n=1 Tax=Penicillium italicum TaxID=40296 RepID=A0A0A2L3M8_PENIT|nr:hypothetical protein PITC_039670 [Penicillium italicum]